MSKATPAVTTVVSQPSFVQPVYVKGEKVWYAPNGFALPCIIVGSQQSGASVTYEIVGDIAGNNVPNARDIGPLKNIPISALTDRT